jgi:non-ribosomal peptide synthase protein (TIGR01720 family)
VAYLAPETGADLEMSELRDRLREWLPEYMVPSAFVVTERLPLTPNGKLDRRALPEPEQSAPSDRYEAPRTRVEQILAEVWQRVLRLDRVGVHDNFFELGGDSILSIQIVSRAAQAGVRLTVRQIFQHQTIAELAEAAQVRVAEEAEEDFRGGVPLTPIQRRFFEQRLSSPHHYNQSVMLKPRRELRPAWLKKAVRLLLSRHGAFRLRYEQAAEGWRQHYAEREASEVFTWVDLSGLPETGRRGAIERVCGRLQASLNLESGPLMRLAYFELGAEAGSRLFWVIHHLAVDGVSWRILLEELESAYEQLEEGREVELPARTSTFGRWARELSLLSEEDALRGELEYWAGAEREGLEPLPRDMVGGVNVTGSERSTQVELNEDETRELLQSVPRAWRTQINEVLLTAVVEALSGWSGREEALVALEGHGRETELLGDVDLSRTVGWFTNVYPALLNRGGGDLVERLQEVKRQLRATPRGGIGYGLLRHMSGEGEMKERLGRMPEPEIIFNYLGQFDQVLDEERLFGWSDEPRGASQGRDGQRPYLLNLSGAVTGGRLRMSWKYSENIYRRETVERLAKSFLDTLHEFIRRANATETPTIDPADFPLAKLDQHQLRTVLQQLRP